jgi:hypothetical protein
VGEIVGSGSFCVDGELVKFHCLRSQQSLGGVFAYSHLLFEEAKVDRLLGIDFKYRS